MNKPLRMKILEQYDTLAEFSHAIHEHPSVISKVLRGQKKLKPEKARQWAVALKVTDSADIFGKETTGEVSF